VVTGANADDGTTAPQLLACVDAVDLPRLEVIFGDNKYNNMSLKMRIEQNRPESRMEVQSLPQDTKWFSPGRIRWVVERVWIFALFWLTPSPGETPSTLKTPLNMPIAFPYLIDVALEAACQTSVSVLCSDNGGALSGSVRE